MRKTWNKNKFEIDFIVEPKLDLGINVRGFSARVLMFEMEFKIFIKIIMCIVFQ
jgi:hypothetical protein